MIKRTGALAEDLGKVPSTHIMAYNRGSSALPWPLGTRCTNIGKTSIFINF